MRKVIHNSGYQKDKKKDKPYVYGSSPLPKIILQPNRSWLDYCPEYEPQCKQFETYNCTTFNFLTPLEILMRRLFGDIGPQRNYSDRWLGIMAGTKPPGNAPHKVAEAAREYGLILETSLPFSDDLQSVDEYYSFKGADKAACIAEGKAWKNQFEFGHEDVIKPNMPLPEKQRRMWECLQYSPLGCAVEAWEEENDLFVKDQYDDDNHWTGIVGAEYGKYWLVKDSYQPELKKLKWDYYFEDVKRYHVAERKTPLPKKASWFDRLQNFIISIFKR